MTSNQIIIQGLRQNNLKNISLELKKNQIIVFTGVSGSGKSSIVFDTIAAESQRQMNETYTAFMRAQIGIREQPREAKDFLQVHNACLHNLKNISVSIPLGVLTVVTGVAGSGKSTLIRDVFAKTYADRVVVVDQSPVTASGRSTAATYLGFFDDIRKLMAAKTHQPLSTLSGGERQRVKLAKELRGTGQIYVLDEPTTGLHASDIGTLMQLFERMVDRGNTVIVIEHNTDVMKQADYIIDIGPDGGTSGGEVVFAGTVAEMLQKSDGITAKYIRKSLASTEIKKQ